MVAKAAKFTKHLGGATVCPRLVDRWAAFFVGNIVVQDLPHQSTEPMCDHADRLRMAEPDDESPVEEFKDAALGLHRGVRRLIEHAPHLAVAARGATAVVDASALVMSGTRADPRREVLGCWKRGRHGANFRDDLLRRVDPEGCNKSFVCPLRGPAPEPNLESA